MCVGGGGACQSLLFLYDLSKSHIVQSVEVHAVLLQTCFFVGKCRKELWPLCARKISKFQTFNFIRFSIKPN